MFYIQVTVVRVMTSTRVTPIEVDDLRNNVESTNVKNIAMHVELKSKV